MTLQQLTSLIFNFCKTHEASITVVLSASVAALVIYIGYKERQELKEPVRDVRDHNKMHYPEYEPWYMNVHDDGEYLDWKEFNS